MLKPTVAILMLSTVFVTPASAVWITKAEDDLFSDKKIVRMIAVEIGSGIVVNCDSDSNVSISYVVEHPDAATMAGNITIPGELVFKADNGRKWSSPTNLYQHNTKYVGFEYLDMNVTRDIIAEFGKADSKILVGLKIENALENGTFTVSAKGSTKAVEDFLQYCPAK